MGESKNREYQNSFIIYLHLNYSNLSQYSSLQNPQTLVQNHNEISNQIKLNIFIHYIDNNKQYNPETHTYQFLIIILQSCYIIKIKSGKFRAFLIVYRIKDIKMIAKSDSFIYVGSYRYKQCDLLGSGYESRVYKATHSVKKFEVALKIIEVDKIQNGIHRKLLDSEFNCLQALKGTPNIINLLDIVKTDNFIYVITELCKGDLAVVNKKGLGQKEAWAYIKQALKGYKSLYEKGIIHRDIKPENMFIKSQGVVKIGDFGFAATQAQAKQQSNYSIGSPSYMAPQVLHRNDYSASSDIWSFGVSYFQLAKGYLPWDGDCQEVLKTQITHDNISKTIQRSGFSNNSINLLRRIFTYDAYYRIKPEQLFEYELFQTEIAKMKSLDSISISTAQTPKCSRKTGNENYNYNKNSSYSEFDNFIDKVCVKHADGNKSYKTPLDRPSRRMSMDGNLLKCFNQQQNLKIPTQKVEVSSQKLIGNQQKTTAFKKKYRASFDVSNQNQLGKDVDNFAQDSIDKTLNGYLQLGNMCLKFLQSSQQINDTQKWVSELTVLKTCLKNHMISTINKLQNIQQSQILSSVAPQQEIQKYIASQAYKKTNLLINNTKQKYQNNKEVKKHWIRVRQQKHRAVTNSGIAFIKAIKCSIIYNPKYFDIVDSACNIVQVFGYLQKNSSITSQIIYGIVRPKRNTINLQNLLKRIQQAQKLK